MSTSDDQAAPALAAALDAVAALTAERDRLRAERDEARMVLAAARDDESWDAGAMVMLYDQAIDARDAALASLAERDRLREDVDHWKARADEHLVAYRRLIAEDLHFAEAERDAALASLAAEREQTARMRAVVEAARAFVASDAEKPDESTWTAEDHHAAEVATDEAYRVLRAAVAALDTGAATPEVPR